MEYDLSMAYADGRQGLCKIYMHVSILSPTPQVTPPLRTAPPGSQRCVLILRGEHVLDVESLPSSIRVIV